MALKIESKDPKTGIIHWSGDLADRPVNGGVAGSTFRDKPNDTLDEWDGDSWIRVADAGADLVIPIGLAPTNYASENITLTQAGTGHAIASGAKQLVVMVKAALSGPVLIAFGTTEVSAEGNVDGTVDSEVGHPVGLPISGAYGTGSTGIGEVQTVPIPVGMSWFSVCESHAAPTGKLLVGQL